MRSPRENFMSKEMATTPLVLLKRAAALGAFLGICAFAVHARQATLTSTPAAAAQPAPAAEDSQELHLLVGRSLVINSPTRIKRISLADPTIAEAVVINPNEVLLNGKAPGGVSLL